MLVFDHTLAFPRLVWAPLILFFPLLGYSMGTIVKALVAMYLLYIVIETVNTLVCYHVAEEDTSSRVEHSGWALLGLPLYRFIVFHFRFSGFLVTLLEEQRWTMTGPVSQTRRDVHWVRVRSVDFLTGLFAATSATWVRLARFAQAVLAPLLLGIGFGAIIELWQNVRR
jgi:biofilm PGA synthesis N-glycosyltransferase PgaC